MLNELFIRMAFTNPKAAMELAFASGKLELAGFVVAASEAAVGSIVLLYDNSPIVSASDHSIVLENGDIVEFGFINMELVTTAMAAPKPVEDPQAPPVEPTQPEVAKTKSKKSKSKKAS